MEERQHRLSIGLPVFNGENFLGEALESLLAQTYTDFEIIISDNASTDATPEICNEFMHRDKRIKYFCNPTNIGIYRNWNRTFELSSGEYFKWAAHDDLYAPTFVEKCIKILDQDPLVALCYTQTKRIDENGKITGDYGKEPDGADSSPHSRFYNMVHFDHWCFQIFGVVRTGLIKHTRLQRPFYGSDRNLIAELSLMGKIHLIPEDLFFRREHSNASSGLKQKGKKDLFAYTKSGKTNFLGFWRILEYAESIHRAPISLGEKLLCEMQLSRIIVEKSIHRLKISLC